MLLADWCSSLQTYLPPASSAFSNLNNIHCFNNHCVALVTCPHFIHPVFFTFSHSLVTSFVWTRLLLSSHFLRCLNRFSAISGTSPHSTAHLTVPSSPPTLPSDSSPPPLSLSSLFVIWHNPPLSPPLCRFLLRLRDSLMWPIVH